MRIKIYQIDHAKDKNRVKFENHEKTLRYAEIIDPSIYKTVFDGDVDCNNLEEVFRKFNTDHPITHQGHSMSVSDIVEVIGDSPLLVGKIKFYNTSDLFEECSYTDSQKYKADIYEANEVGRTIKAISLDGQNVPSVKNGFYFCDSEGFEKLEDDFDTTQVAPMKGYRMLVVEPHKLPYEATIEEDYRALQKAVGGNFECNYPYDDGTFLICNEEGKLNGMEGNRKIFDDIITGTFLIAENDGQGGLKNLTDAHVEKYKKQFQADETYTQDEVEGTAFITFIGFN
ncbi:MAG: DUF3846 domain-containing protein [Eubacteriales bacterium]